MPPKPSVIKEELAKTVRDLFKTDRNSLTVNLVRKNVEENLGLDEGFFRGPNWKQKSKELITNTVVCLLSCQLTNPLSTCADS